MKNVICGLISLALAVVIVEHGHAQAIPSMPATVPGEAAKSTPYAWPSPTICNPYPTLSLPICSAPPACTANEDTNGHLLKGDALLDSSPWASGGGWFGALEADPIGPAVKNRLHAPLTTGGIPTNLQLPSADLNWTAMPNVELGYRLGQAGGELLVSYRGLNAAGSGTISAFDSAGSTAPLSSHLSMSVVDFDYANRENSLGPLWDMKWRTGVRVATIFFDSNAATPILSQHESNNFVGAGLHLGLELKRRLGDSGWCLLGKIDGGAVLGRVNQMYGEVVPGVGSGSIVTSANEPAPVLEVRFGVDFAPQELPNLHFSTGYLFQRRWTVGETDGTQGEVTYQGVFWRGEWRY